MISSENIKYVREQKAAKTKRIKLIKKREIWNEKEIAKIPAVMFADDNADYYDVALN